MFFKKYMALTEATTRNGFRQDKGFQLSVEHGIRRGAVLLLLSDFGDHTAQGEYIKAAVNVSRDQRVSPDIISIADIGALNIAHGAWVTQRQLTGEQGAVCVTVVDPGVGTEREPVAIVTKDENVIIAPNNGVGYPAANDHGIDKVYELLPERVSAMSGLSLSRTFHGRDLFAPAGALVASGVNLAEFAQPLDKDSLVEFELQKGSLLHIDQFGNLKVSDAIPDDATVVRLNRKKTPTEPAITAIIPVVPKFADAKLGTLCAYTGSSGGLEIAINKGRADKALSSLDLQVGQVLDYSFGR